MNAAARAEALVATVTGVEEDMTEGKFGVEATVITVSVTIRVRNESMRAVLVLGEVIGAVEATLDAPGNLGPSAFVPRGTICSWSCTRLLPSRQAA